MEARAGGTIVSPADSEVCQSGSGDGELSDCWPLFLPLTLVFPRHYHGEAQCWRRLGVADTVTFLSDAYGNSSIPGVFSSARMPAASVVRAVEVLHCDDVEFTTAVTDDVRVQQRVSWSTTVRQTRC